MDLDLASELELISAMFPDSARVEGASWLELDLDGAKLELSFPAGYPGGAKPAIHIRFQSSVPEATQRGVTAAARGPDSAFEAIEAARAELAIWQESSGRVGAGGSAQEPSIGKEAAETATAHRTWFYSHHIYDPAKRKALAGWSSELCLRGFVMLGKPGLVVVEGASREALRQFAKRIKGLAWKRLVVRLEETDVSPVFDGFPELQLPLHGARANHPDLGALRLRLESEWGLPDVFPILFPNT